MKTKPTGVQKTVHLGLFLAAGIILAIFEMYIPRPLPWAKPGLANAVALIIIYLFGFRDALLINCARVVFVSLLTGSFAGPGFWLALSAAFASTVSMFFIVSHFANIVGPVGVSLVGAFTHIFTQLLVAGVFIIGRIEVLHLLPLFVSPALFAGLIVGIFAYLILLQLEKRLKLKYPLPNMPDRV
jgi:heptaprenyl diphosphate synthase